MAAVRIAKTGSMVGLDIGADLIKVVEAKAGRDGITVTGLGLAPTPQGAFENGAVADAQAIGKAVKALLSESGIKGKKVVVSVSGQSSTMPSLVIRVIKVPNMSEEELKETMKWEVEKQVPFAPTEIVMDFQKLEKIGQDPNAQEMEVLLAVAQQDLINNQIGAVYSSGLKPAAIDIHPLAASRTLIDLSSNGNEALTVAILDIGATVSELSVFENGLLVFPSPPIQIAGKTFTQAIAAALGISENDAESLKKERARIDPDLISEILASPISQDAMFGQPSAPYPPQSMDYGDIYYGDTGQVDLSGGFESTIDGPVFDLSDDGLPISPAPRIDLSGEIDDIDQRQSYDIGGSQFEARKPVFDLSEEEAPLEISSKSETEGQALDLPAPKQQDEAVLIAQALAPVLQDMVGQIRLNLDYYRSLYNNQVEKIYLCGGSATMRGLDEYLTRELGIPVQVANPFAGVKVTSKKFSEQYLQGIAPVFAVSLGLAVRDLLLEG